MPMRQALQSLTQSVVDAATYLSTIDENMLDDEQSARDVLSHLVFWHREYATIVGALAQGRKPVLRVGKYYEMNALACAEFQNTPMRVLAKRFIRAQIDLERTVQALPNQHIKLGFKEGSQKQPLDHWLPRIQAHIDGHISRLKRIEKKNKRQT